MMSALVRFSIRFSGVIIGLATLVVVYGLYSLMRSNLNVFPEFSPTQIIIQTESPGLSSELVESLVTQPIESSIAGTVGIESMRSHNPSRDYQSLPSFLMKKLIFIVTDRSLQSAYPHCITSYRKALRLISHR